MTLNRRAWPIIPILAALIAATGLGLRIASFGWNTRIQGDVNLMALTAREFVQHNRLYYPMIYGGAELRPFMTLNPVGSPATQHPPLYPFLAGLIGKLVGGDDTFSYLKLLDEAGGLALLGALLWTALRRRDEAPAWLAAGAMAAAAPLLVDFSANGSPYILSTLAILLAILLIRAFRMERLRDYVLAGLICGLGLQFHTIVAGLPAAFVVLWIAERRHIRWAGIGLFVLAMALTLAPWMAWSEVTMGQLRPPSSDYILGQLSITSYSQMLQPAVFGHYLKLIGSADRGFAEMGYREVGPFLPILAAIGLYFLARTDRRALLAVALPELAYLAIELAWPTFQFRFMVPAVLPLIVAAGFGFARLPGALGGRRWLGWAVGGLLLAGSIGWSLPVYFHDPPTHYYGPGRETTIAKQYPHMQALASVLGQQPAGMTLGMASMLDQGIETVYWSHQPLVLGGVKSDAKALRDHAAAYSVRYVWTDSTLKGTVEAAFPDAKVIGSDGPFVLYELAGK